LAQLEVGEGKIAKDLVPSASGIEVEEE